MVNIDVGANVRDLIERGLEYAMKETTFSGWDFFWGTSIGAALTADYALRGGRSPFVCLGLQYAGMLLNKTRGGMWIVAVVGAWLYYRHVTSETTTRTKK